MVIDRLAEITCPTVMICGVDDRPVYVTGVRYLAERLPNATLVEIVGAAHEPHVDRPDEVTAALHSHEALLAGR
jgi:3-oxoadipate enol-lactonase/4-carboxymuconolactone decarboxylase